MPDPMVQAMFGVHALQSPCQLVLQCDTKPNASGKWVTMVVGLIVTDEDPRSSGARQERCLHELIVGDVVIRPHGKFASRHFVGSGAAALLTGGALFPDGHQFTTLDNSFSQLHPSRTLPPTVPGSEAEGKPVEREGAFAGGPTR